MPSYFEPCAGFSLISRTYDEFIVMQAGISKMKRANRLLCQTIRVRVALSNVTHAYTEIRRGAVTLFLVYATLEWSGFEPWLWTLCCGLGRWNASTPSRGNRKKSAGLMGHWSSLSPYLDFTLHTETISCLKKFGASKHQTIQIQNKKNALWFVCSVTSSKIEIVTIS